MKKKGGLDGIDKGLWKSWIHKTASGMICGMYYVYILECEDKSYYTGITTDVQRRFQEHLQEHLAKKGGAYTRVHKPVRVVYSEACKNRSEALKREFEIKNWPKKKKTALITSVSVTEPFAEV